MKIIKLSGNKGTFEIDRERKVNEFVCEQLYVKCGNLWTRTGQRLQSWKITKILEWDGVTSTVNAVKCS